VDTGTAQGSVAANTALGGVTARANINSTVGNGGGISVYTVTKAAAGSTGSTTATLATSSVQGRITLALLPDAGGGAGLGYPRTAVF